MANRPSVTAKVTPKSSKASHNRQPTLLAQCNPKTRGKTHLLPAALDIDGARDLLGRLLVLLLVRYIEEHRH
jgi:hypothetical protein